MESAMIVDLAFCRSKIVPEAAARAAGAPDRVFQ
jgi:hypothetical protein